MKKPGLERVPGFFVGDCNTGLSPDDFRAREVDRNSPQADKVTLTPVFGFPCKPVGCLECRHSGYLGRVGIYEILLLWPAIKRLSHEEADLAKLPQQAYTENMKRFPTTAPR